MRGTTVYLQVCLHLSAGAGSHRRPTAAGVRRRLPGDYAGLADALAAQPAQPGRETATQAAWRRCADARVDGDQISSWRRNVCDTCLQFDSETREPIAVQEKKALDTHWMVEEFMLLANISVAEKIRADFPDCAVLRRHPVARPLLLVTTQIPPSANFKPVQQAAQKRGFTLSIDNGKALADSLDKANIKGNPFFNTMLRMLTTRCMTQVLTLHAS